MSLAVRVLIRGVEGEDQVRIPCLRRHRNLIVSVCPVGTQLEGEVFEGRVRHLAIHAETLNQVQGRLLFVKGYRVLVGHSRRVKGLVLMLHVVLNWYY